MSDRAGIGERIKKLRNERNFSQTQVADILFISQAAYSLIENSQNGIVAEHLIRLSKLYNVSADFILTGETNYIKVGRDTGFVPLIKANSYSKFLENLESDSFVDIKHWFKIPGFDPSKDQTLFEVDGDSMAPAIFPGDILICQIQHNVENVLDGSAVVVITVEGIMIKRLRIKENSEYFLMEDDNGSKEDSEKLNKKDIKKLLMIRGKISNVLIPSQEVKDTNKIKSLEESVDMLRKELFSMNKKLNALTGE